MSQVPIGSKWKCAQGGGLEITVISEHDERNVCEGAYWKKRRTGDVVYVYTHNEKVGAMKQFDTERWYDEWSLIAL